jgi:hypothetical protein
LNILDTDAGRRTYSTLTNYHDESRVVVGLHRVGIDHVAGQKRHAFGPVHLEVAWFDRRTHQPPFERAVRRPQADGGTVLELEARHVSSAHEHAVAVGACQRVEVANLF